jgi:hypothetical protein
MNLVVVNKEVAQRIPTSLDKIRSASAFVYETIDGAQRFGIKGILGDKILVIDPDGSIGGFTCRNGQESVVNLYNVKYVNVVDLTVEVKP